MVAARKLYPDARLFFCGPPEPNVREFVALHRGHLEVDLPGPGIPEQVDFAILVDTREPSRLGPFRHVVSRPEVTVHVYDHHPPTAEGIAGDLEFIEPVGASVTVVLKRVLELGLEIAPWEATLFLLALHEETGSFTFPDTTPEDLRVGALMLERGGSLALIPQFVGRRLSEAQQGMLADLLGGSRSHQLGGLTVTFALAEREDYLEELALLAHHLMDLDRPDVLFLVVRMGRKVSVVARSGPDTVDVGRILEPMGGGGHPRAASATLTAGPLEAIVEAILARIQAGRPRVLRARDLMSRPVQCLDLRAAMSVEEGGRRLQELGHSAVCVRQAGRWVGVLARSDVDKALAHGLGHAPVQSFMSRALVWVGPEETLPEIQRVLVERDIGRVPVLEEGELVGIVSRTDLLRALQEGGAAAPTVRADVPRQLLELEPRRLAWLRRSGVLAEELGVEVYAVGGLVRDLLLGRPCLDLDLVVEGDGVAFAQALARALGGRCTVHGRFGTASIQLEAEGETLDVATARTERYTRPAALPTVEGSTLKQDLFRRDFSINALALVLKPGRFGEIVDFFGGRRDLQAGWIRVLHNLSFIDDPTRIFRAVRFEQRYGFRMEPTTEHLLQAALRQEVLGWLSPERIRDEVILLLTEARPLPALLRLEKLKVWRALHPRLQIDPKVRRALEETAELLLQARDLEERGLFEPWLVWLSVLLSGLGAEAAREVASRFRLPARDLRKLEWGLGDPTGGLRRLAWGDLPDSQLFELLSPLPVEALLYLAARTRSVRVRERILRYLRVLRVVPRLLGGDDLLALGFSPGPRLGAALAWVHREHLDGRLATRAQALEAVAARWSPEGGPAPPEGTA